MFSKASLLFLLPTVAWGYTLFTQNMRGWEQDELSFRFNPAGCSLPAEKIEEAIEASVRLWNGVGTADLRISYEGRTDRSGTDSNPTVECLTSGLGGILGASTVSTSNGRIFSAHIELNAEPGATGDISKLNQGQLEITLAHEMGHILGLGHSAHRDSLMYFALANKQQLSLSQDDADGLSYLYPRKEPEDGILGCGTLEGNGPGPGGGNGLLPLLALLGILTAWLRRPHTQRSQRAAL